MKIKNIFLRILQIGIVVILFYYVVSPLFKNAEAFKETFFTLNPFFLVLGILVLSMVISCYPFVWRFIMKGFGHDLPARESLVSWSYSNVGKYIPGKVWQFVGRVALTKSIKPEVTLITVFLEVIISSTSAVMVFFIRFLVSGGISPMWVLYAFLLFAVLLLLQHPAFIKFFLKLYAKIRKQEVDFTKTNLNLKRNLAVFSFYFILWILTGFSLWIMIQRSSVDISFVDAVTTYPISWVLGYVAIIAPAGLGVRESVLMTLLRSNYKVEVASSFSILTRIAFVLADFLLFLVVFAFFGRGTLMPRKSKEIQSVNPH